MLPRLPLNSTHSHPCPLFRHHLIPSCARIRCLEGAASKWHATDFRPERSKPPDLLAEALEKSGEVSALGDSPIPLGSPRDLDRLGLA